MEPAPHHTSINQTLLQDTLYQDYRYLVGVYNNQYVEIMRQIEDLRRESILVRSSINAVTLDMRNRISELRRTTQSGRGIRTEDPLQSLIGLMMTEGIFSPTRPNSSPGLNDISTPQHINDAIRVVRHGDLLDRETYDRCPISWSTFDVNERVTQIIQCGHVFNSSELSRWFRTSAQCPICRYDIRTYRREEVVQNQDAADPETNNEELGATQIRDDSGNLVGTEMTNLLNWAHGFN